ncbi:hypothetical protein PPACK8108_LOCUS1841 [Phakopsora pachyrhizi]|uniref:HMG box domain-containing protein n=1 Tax=Phakopsora pachyrhizi TaxID=170000 RepID=A0AAV0AGK8_PHAPC|nr:hypothetical protein PPACK8108_LOCUS1841 [Phakopsora pachyrhizi]
MADDESSLLSPEKKVKKIKSKTAEKKSQKAKPAKKLVPPKRPMNIMQLVTQDVISEIKAREGRLTSEAAKGSFKIAAERHRSLSEAEKEEYIRRLEQKKQEYEVEMRSFLDSLTPEDYINQNEYVRRRKALGRPSRRRGIPRIDPNAPKRPLNGFLIFCADLRTNPSKFPDLNDFAQLSAGNASVTEGSKALASYWRKMSEESKQCYMLEAQRQSDLYKQAKLQYDAQSKALTEKLKQLKV